MLTGMITSPQSPMFLCSRHSVIRSSAKAIYYFRHRIYSMYVAEFLNVL
jgi:hypothetical protein